MVKFFCIYCSFLITIVHATSYVEGLFLNDQGQHNLVIRPYNEVEDKDCLLEKIASSKSVQRELLGDREFSITRAERLLPHQLLS